MYRRYSDTLVSKTLGHFHRDFIIVTSEDFIDLFLFKFRGDEADERHEHEPCDHSEHTGINRGREEVIEHGVCEGGFAHHHEQLKCRDAHTRDKADPYSRLCYLLHKQAVEERGEERPCERTPADTH